MQKTSELIWQDAQHQVLFELIEQIKDKQVNSTVFSRLTEYAEHHFCLEEIYMERINYPDLEAHKKAHDQFRQELNVMLESCHEYDDRLRETLSMFLTEWLKRHVFGLDKKLEQYILESSHK